MDILTKLEPFLLGLKKPARYVGGEFGSINTTNHNSYKIALAFPDLYEIAMSNQALSLLYFYLNQIEGIEAERVFAVASDMEALLKNEHIPLYTLESFTPIKECDMLAFTIGYELSLTNILSMLDLAGLAFKTKDRLDTDPLIIAGGPAVVNPTIWGEIFDAVYIGEFEASFSTFSDLANLKNKSKAEQLEHLLKNPSFWVAGKKAVRASWAEFGESGHPLPMVNNIEIAQDHGVVEIMRGCPNGCRFCLAGTYYKPFRCKKLSVILQEVDDLINLRGCSEISLNSLSSADFPYIEQLLVLLNQRYKNRHISFSLPSLRVNSFGLDLLDQLSSVRRSGLTFAVETAFDKGQFALNKPIEEAKIHDILNEASKRGWKKAKFYFMVGLPLGYTIEEESNAIADYMINLYNASKFEFNVNVGIFIPKPHTPYQRAKQLNEEDSRRSYAILKERLAKYKKIKIGFHSTFFAVIEGLLARGDEKVVDIAIRAYKNGARFDAWEDLATTDVWQDALDNADKDYLASVFSDKDEQEILPWQSVDFRLRKNYLEEEARLSTNQTITKACHSYPCSASQNGPDMPCGACNKETHVKRGDVIDDINYVDLKQMSAVSESPSAYFQRINFVFKKDGRAKYLSHLDLVNIFKKAFIRTGLQLRYTQGFNPQPHIDFSSPLSLGIASNCEEASVEICGNAPSGDKFLQLMKNNLNDGLEVLSAFVEPPLPEGRKYKSLMSNYGGAVYLVSTPQAEILHEQVDKFIGGNDFITPSSFKLEAIDKNSFSLTIYAKGGKLENISKLLEAVLDFNVLTKSGNISLKRVQILHKN